MKPLKYKYLKKGNSSSNGDSPWRRSLARPVKTKIKKTKNMQVRAERKWVAKHTRSRSKMLGLLIFITGILVILMFAGIINVSVDFGRIGEIVRGDFESSDSIAGTGLGAENADLTKLNQHLYAVEQAALTLQNKARDSELGARAELEMQAQELLAKLEQLEKLEQTLPPEVIAQITDQADYTVSLVELIMTSLSSASKNEKNHEPFYSDILKKINQQVEKIRNKQYFEAPILKK